MRPKFIKYFMDFAELTASLSYAKRLKVGAVIVKDNGQIIGNGYNGMPSSWDNNCENTNEDGSLKTRPEVLHAESNSILKVARSTESSEGATMFCTHAPCMDCAKLIFQSGIKTIYYKNQYREDAGIKFLMISGVNVHRYPDSI
jgi:dCMP deaminase